MSYGVFAVIAASVLFGITPSANNYVLLRGMEPDCLLFYQAVTMVLGSGGLIAWRKLSLKVTKQMALELLALGIVGMGLTDYFLNLSYEYLPVSTVVMLHFLYPAIVLVVSVLAFHQKPSLCVLGAVVLSITGLVLVTDFDGGINGTGVLFALGSAATYAFYAIENDRGSVSRLPLAVRLFYVSLVTLVTYFVKTMVSGNFSLPADGKTAFAAVGIVGVGSLLGFYLITMGIKRIGASKASFLNMLEPITGVVFGVLLYQEAFPLRSKAGCVCVLLSVFLIALDGHRNRKKTEENSRSTAAI